MTASAKLLEFGRVRDFWVAVLRPVGVVSQKSRFCWFRQVTQDKVGEWLNR